MNKEVLFQKCLAKRELPQLKSHLQLLAFTYLAVVLFNLFGTLSNEEVELRSEYFMIGLGAMSLLLGYLVHLLPIQRTKVVMMALYPLQRTIVYVVYGGQAVDEVSVDFLSSVFILMFTNLLDFKGQLVSLCLFVFGKLVFDLSTRESDDHSHNFLVYSTLVATTLFLLLYSRGLEIRKR